IVEVGPGLGSLTEDLLACGNNLLLIELDAKFAEFWRSRGVDVIEGDALDLRWDELRLPAGSRLVSNLPYQIGSRLVVDVSVSAPAIDSMVLMFQKEVAERMAAAPKSKAYG